MKRDKTNRYRKPLYGTVTVMVAAALTSHTLTAQNPPAPIPPFSICSQNVNTYRCSRRCPGHSQPRGRWRCSV